MLFRSLSIPLRPARVLTFRPFWLCLLALTLFAWTPFLGAEPSYATTLAPVENRAAQNARPYASYVIQLEGEPVAAFYASLMADEQAQSASVNALTQAQLATVEAAQMQLMDTLATYDAQVIYRVQRVFNGIAIYAPADQVAAIAALPGVLGVYPLIPKEPTNARAAELLDMPEIWQGIDHAGATGAGISIAIIDTGTDYLHTIFGGPGTGNLLNDTKIIGDAANFPGPKVVGGYDFAGDTYDATPSSSAFQPVPTPDPDPMDCYGFGHGTHVSGTAAGYGVRADGTTYPGPYDTTINLNALRIGPGMAPEAAIYALKVFGCSGSSNVVDAAIEWAVDPNQDGDFSDHVDVINLSLGSSFGASFDATTIAVENAAKLGIIVVTSAGNTGDVHYAVGSPGMATRAIAVAATSVDSSNPANTIDGSVASFSARGPRRDDHTLKPDLAAPGVNIFSARRATGSQGVSSSGTSMASPVVAGTMALLRQAHPESGTAGWRSQELKALVMNTARYPFVRQDNATPYSLLRVGAGRIDPATALQSNLIAYDAAAPEQVSVSFGAIEVLDGITAVRSIRLANKSNAPISVTIGYTAVSNLPGVTIEVGAGKIITVPALGFATTPVTLTANAAAMSRRPDPSRQLTPPNAQPWLDEASGYISFTPVITTSGPTIHLPILALPRTLSAFASTLTAGGSPIDLASTITASFPLTITGNAISNGIAPTQSVPLVGVFGLALSSPPLTELPNGEPLLGRYGQADLRYIGTAGPLLVNGEPMLYFALVSYAPWSTPLEVTYEIELDVDGDGLVEYRLQNRESTDVSTYDFATTDDFVSMLEPVGASRKIQGPLNVYPSTQYDTRPFNNNVMILPLRLNDLGDNVTTLHYQVISSSRDVMGTGNTSELVEITPILSLVVSGDAGLSTNRGVPLFPAATGDRITLTFDRAAYVKQQSKGLLLLYMDNEMTARTEVLPVQYDWFNHQYLPGIHRD